MPSKTIWQKIKWSNRYVFMTGDTDMNREDTKYVLNEYKKLRIKHIDYVQVPGMGHDIPSSEWLAKAMDILDRIPKNEPAKKLASSQTSSLPPLKLKFD